MKTIVALATVIFLMWHIPALAYEQQTHAAITDAAVRASKLGGTSGELLLNFGLVEAEPLDIQLKYFDVVSPYYGALGAIARAASDYEEAILRSLELERGATPHAWIIRGAIREDDNPNEQPPTPQDVSPGL